MANGAQALRTLLRRATASQGEVALTSQQQRFASSISESAYAQSTGKYSPGIFSKQKPLDRSHQWVHKNPYIEAWYYRRDHFEREFVWNYRNTIEAFWLLGGFTAGGYYLSDYCLRNADRRSGYPRRTVLGDEPGFVLPDEREFY